jgi:hypothetical protein
MYRIIARSTASSLLGRAPSMMFSVTLLASCIGWSWLAGMTAIGVLTLLLAFMLEMEIAGKA